MNSSTPTQPHNHHIATDSDANQPIPTSDTTLPIATQINTSISTNNSTATTFNPNKSNRDRFMNPDQRINNLLNRLNNYTTNRTPINNNNAISRSTGRRNSVEQIQQQPHDFTPDNNTFIGLQYQSPAKTNHNNHINPPQSNYSVRLQYSPIPSTAPQLSNTATNQTRKKSIAEKHETVPNGVMNHIN